MKRTSKQLNQCDATKYIQEQFGQGVLLYAASSNVPQLACHVLMDSTTVTMRQVSW